MATSNTSVTSSPVAVFSPSGSDTSGVLYNSGTSTLYLGQANVTAATGFPLPAGASLQVNFAGTIYAVAGQDTTVTPTNTASAPVTQGATTITVASGGASFTNGMVVAIQDGNSSELVTVGAGSTGTTVNISATTKAHASGVAFGQFSKHAGGSIRTTM